MRSELVGPMRRLLTRHLLSGLAPASLAAWTHRHILADPAWATYYHQLRRIERAAGGSPLGAGQVDLIEDLLLGPSAEPGAQARSTWGRSLAVAGAVAACALLLVVTRGDSLVPSTAASGWQARGAADDEDPAVGLRVRCIASGADRVLAQAEVGPRSPVGDLRCPASSLLWFSGTNLTAEPVHLFVVGVSQGGGLRWFAPFEEGASSVLLDPGEVDRPMEALAGTAAMPLDEEISLFAVFSQRPWQGKEIARLARSSSSRGLALERVARLPLDETLQARIALRMEDLRMEAPTP